MSSDRPALLRRLADGIEWIVFVAAGAAVVMLFTLAGADDGEEAADSDVAIGAAVDDNAATADGEALYASRCANCHGDNGQGAIGPRLEDLSDRYPDRAQLLAIVANGRGIMPGFVTNLSADEIDAVIDHVLERFG